MILRPEPLTRATFAPFGDVIETRAEGAFDINDGYTTRNHALATAQTDADVILSIFEGRVRPMTVGMVECHPVGSQAFMPLGNAQWLVVVAEEPRPEACRAFLAQGNQGVQYSSGVWHHPLMVIGAPQDFLVVDRAGQGDNLQEVFFDQVLTIEDF